MDFKAWPLKENQNLVFKHQIIDEVRYFWDIKN